MKPTTKPTTRFVRDFHHSCFAALLAALIILPGCNSLGGSGATAMRIESRDRDTWMAPAYVTSVYRAIDENTADIFLSDVPEDQLLERLRMGADGSAGTLTHIRLFLSPKAGKTPIDFTASNSTVTHIVLAGGAVGIYGGGGFLLPDNAIGAEQFGGRIKNASIKLLRSDDGFADLLGLAELSGTIRARRDDTLADSVSARMTLLMKRQ